VLRRVLNRSILLFVIFAIPTVASSVARAIDKGWQPVFGMQIGLLLLMCVLLWRRQKTSSTVKASVLISVCVLVTWGGLATFGVMAAAGHWFAALSAFLIGMVCTTRGGYIASGIVLAGMAAIAMLEIGGVIVPLTPAEVFVAELSYWIVELLCALLFMAVVLPAVGDYKAAIRAMIVDSEARRDKIAYFADHDLLTGLPLLRLVRDHLDMACRRAQRSGGKAALLFIDLDGFKALNDSEGHEAGDVCLKAVADRLTQRLRGEDTAARIGGDEFVVVLDEVSGSEGAAQVAAQLISLINEPIPFADKQLHVGASIGIALYPDNCEDGALLQTLADQAMYQAKGFGSNQYVLSATTVRSPAVTALPVVPTAIMTTGAEQPPPREHVTLLESIVDRAAIVFCLLIVPALVANLWRIVANNAAPNVGAMVSAVLALAVLALGRRLLPMPVKSTLICCVGLMVAIPGTLKSGLAAPVPGWGFAVSLYLSSVIFNDWIGRLVAVLIPVTLIAAAYGFTAGASQAAYDVAQHAVHPGTWLVFILVGAAVFGIFLSVWSLYKNATVDLIQERAQQAADLQKLADFDQLTGLPLQRLLEKRFGQSVQRARRVQGKTALLFVDLDGFKAVNDQYGHDAGNYCLCQLASRMSSVINDVDTVARIGGDEFLVLVDSVSNPEQVAMIAQTLLDVIAQPLQLEGKRFSVSASLGIALYPDHGSDFEPLRKCSDAAMYQAKSDGKNGFSFFKVAS